MYYIILCHNPAMARKRVHLHRRAREYAPFCCWKQPVRFSLSTSPVGVITCYIELVCFRTSTDFLHKVISSSHPLPVYEGRCFHYLARSVTGWHLNIAPHSNAAVSSDRATLLSDCVVNRGAWACIGIMETPANRGDMAAEAARFQVWHRVTQLI